MRLILLAVGRVKDGPERQLIDRYIERGRQTARALGFSGPDIIELAEGRAGQAAARMEEEAAAIRAKAGDAVLVLLDERGQSPTSPDFAKILVRYRDEGRKTLALVIGGADGLDPSLRGEADLVLSFGCMTLPHQLVRLVASEQVYRAMTIISGHPYHRI
jgi:23S rRNA (pseudouridine1915-N3)-methyltransferase